MAIEASVFFVAVPVLLEELADGHLVRHQHVQILAVVTFLARLFEPVNTHFLFSFVLIHLVLQTVHNRRNFINGTRLVRIMHSLTCPFTLSTFTSTVAIIPSTGAMVRTITIAFDIVLHIVLFFVFRVFHHYITKVKN